MHRNAIEKKVDYCDKLMFSQGFVETIYDLEDVIDELIIKSAQRSNRDASFLYRLFEALATRIELRPTVRRQARRLRDEFKSLQDFLKDIEQSKELSEAGMAWMEELCDVCRSAENFVGLFLQRMKNEKRGPLQNLQEPPPRDSDQLDMVSFDEDVDAVMAQLLKDDHRCITISIAGVGGIGKTCLAKLIYDSQAIADHFPYRIWVSEKSEVGIMKRFWDLMTFRDYSGRNETEESYAFRLRQMVNAFFADKKYLIVVKTLIHANSGE
ncbi:hypothetical protein GH714_006488 [Hevea brasiliensis]|uniref:NB-ARC domain-containing protein n=1 Tax=Hevea brasiliensis TaxID=3981 RepID=A0A6A6N8X9_HEVBR|nr:hypothetical protein GH714_006377 [Hevea brasiliensis]KAF2322087.1 hypothetical protein GH714_006488 [Hevea brasiliensis]